MPDGARTPASFSTVDEQTRIQAMRAVAPNVPAPTPAEDEFVTNWRSGLKARKGTALGDLYEKQNAEREIRDAAFANKPTEDPGEGFYWQWQERNQTWAKIRATGFGAPAPSGGGGGGGGGNTAVVTATTSTTYTGGGTTTDPLKLNGANFTGSVGGVNYVNGVREDTAKRTAQQDFRAALAELGLADLADTIDGFIREDLPVSRIKLELPKTQAYKDRFPGMEALRAAGQAVREDTYISMERGYLQTLQAYGLDTKALGSRKQLGTYIANLVSPREFEERVTLAATRVKENADVISQFKAYYPEVDNSALTAYLLNPAVGMDIIKRQVRVAEIGAAAVNAGFTELGSQVGLGAATGLINAVGTSDLGTLKKEFDAARTLATQQERLSRLEGQQYSQIEAVNAAIARNQGAILQSQQRAARETARFGGASGLTSASLRGDTEI
jgi:hypothetical protein